MKDLLKRIENVSDEALGKVLLEEFICIYSTSDQISDKISPDDFDFHLLGQCVREDLLLAKSDEQFEFGERMVASFTGACLAELLDKAEEHNLEEKEPFKVLRAYEDDFIKFLEDIGADNYGNVENFADLETNTAIDNEVFTLRPYYWGDDEEVEKLPNFVYKPDNLEINWYKYPFRGAYSNKKITGEYLNEIIADCKRSVRREK